MDLTERNTCTVINRALMFISAIEFDAPINPKDANEWIKFNVNQTAFYRVNYPADHWQKLSNILETSHEVRIVFGLPLISRDRTPSTTPLIGRNPLV
jgi:hypothetical protein